MNEHEGKSNFIEPVPEGIMDSELAMFLVQHIDNPCSVEVGPDDIRDIREFYIREALRLLPKMKNEQAAEALRLKIAEYRKDK